MSKFILTPTLDALVEWARQVEHRVLVLSPFVNQVLLQLDDCICVNADRRLITRANVLAFARGVSSLRALRSLKRRGWTVQTLPSLHAKVYIFDQSRALVTSANATRRGLLSNLECGVVVTEPSKVLELQTLLERHLQAAGDVTTLSREDLKKLEAPVRMVKEACEQAAIRERTLLPEEDVTEISLPWPAAEFLAGFTGWKRLTLSGILRLPQEFTLAEVYEVCGPLAARHYPRNKNWQAKLRQQLQFLRDLGIVLFCGQGRYKRLYTFEAEEAIEEGNV